jgi:hypothetical protein
MGKDQVQFGYDKGQFISIGVTVLGLVRYFQLDGVQTIVLCPAAGKFVGHGSFRKELEYLCSRSVSP